VIREPLKLQIAEREVAIAFFKSTRPTSADM